MLRCMFRFARPCLLAALVSLAPLASGAGPAAPPLTPAERGAIIDALRANCDPSSGEAIKFADSGLLEAVSEAAEAELAQRVRPSDVDRAWAYDPPRHDIAAELAAAREAGRLGAWLKSLSPSDPRYRALIAARCRYQAMTWSGGWRPLPAGLRVSLGEQRPDVKLLRQRLAAEGYLPRQATASVTFDESVQRGLRSFQQRHGLAANGLVDGKTLAALNVSAETRLQQIEVNLERWRWLARPLLANRAEVDVAAAQMTLYRDGVPALTMRAIVGDPRHHTPLFTAPRLQAVVFNPPWNVPDSIARAEILPKAAKNPGYLARENMTFVDGRLQQRPGPKNALGQLKIDFPSPFGVYLHDTPAKSLFGRAVRALSHGCMRLEKPRELAAALLANQGWTAERIDAAIAQGATQRVELKGAPPLFVIYTTAEADASGAVTFRPDPYGWDDRLRAALAPSLASDIRVRAATANGDVEPGQFGP